MKTNRFWTIFAATLFAMLVVGVMPALADGMPVDKGISLQPAATSSAQRIHEFHDMLLYIITGIVIFVFVLLAIVVVRFNAKANPTPSKTTHNVLLEVIWTVVPVVILIIIAVPSFKLLYQNDRIEKPEMTLKVTGYQWYWGYEYPDNDGVAFEARMVPDAEIKGDQKRLLSTDNVVVLPVETNIAVLVTGNDVIHSWAVPAFGVKIDAVPLRTNETWFRIEKPGVYYGQCSEICGKDHAYMPIEIRAVSKEEFKAWIEKAKLEFSFNQGSVNANIKLSALQN